MHNFKIYHIFVIAIYGSQCIWGLVMERVTLSQDKSHLRLQKDKNGVLECRFNLEEGENVKAITWYHDDLMALKWAPPEPTTIGEGLNKGDAVLSRQDGNLEFKTMRLGLAGKYHCEVMTSKGQTYQSFDYQVLIVDMPENVYNDDHEVENCKINFSWSAPPINPRPEITCGVWSIEHGYVLKAASWSATPYYNGSVAYDLEEENFQISHMPLDAVIKCEIKITKIDDSEVVLLEKKYNFTEVWERGCYPLEVDEGIELIYDNERRTCHAEIKSRDERAPVTAHVKCKDGYISKYQDFVTSVDMICQGTKWNVGAGLTWNHFDNLICEVKPTEAKLPPKPPSSSLKNFPEEETTSGSNTSLTSWILSVLLVFVAFSGVLWGIKTHTKRKDPRHMA